MPVTETLITGYEIVRQFPTEVGFDTGKLNELIVLKEEILFKNQLGRDFYTDLLADKNTPVYTHFDEAASYVIGNVVLFNHILYECIKNTTNEKPENVEYWKQSEKFVDSDYNYIWNRYLKNAISWLVIRDSSVFTTLQTSAKGIQKKFSDTTESASIQELGYFTSTVGKGASDWLLLLEDYICQYMEDNSSATKFDNYLPYKEQVSSRNKKRRKNLYYGFNINVDD